MYKSAFKKLFTFFVLAGMITSCEKEEINPDSQLTISANIINSPVVLASLHQNENGQLDFNSGYVWISEIGLDGDMTNGQSISLDIERFSKIDFATGIADPSLDDIVIPAGEYQSISLGVELRDEDEQPSILMEGTYTRMDGSISPIRFEFNSGEVFEAESDGTTVIISQTAISRISFDPSIWFSVIAAERLDDADLDNQGVIVISENANEAIFDDVADRLDISTEATF